MTDYRKLHIAVLSIALFFGTAIGLPSIVYGGDSSYVFQPAREDEVEEGLTAASTTAPSAEQFLGAYMSPLSVKQGETIELHVSTDYLFPFDAAVWREGAVREKVDVLQGLEADEYSCQDGYTTGCGWPVAYRLHVPIEWPSGVYTVDVPTASSGQLRAIFWVREQQPGSVNRLLFLSSVNTMQAYNNYGGKSLYPYNSSDGEKAQKVSFMRPFSNYRGVGKFARWERKLLSWLDTEGYTPAFATEKDLEEDPGLLAAYDVVVISGHSEYWSWEGRRSLQNYIEGGGRVLLLAGNTFWWQVRFEDGGQTLVAYKDYRTDPATDRTQITDNPIDFPILDSPYALSGAHWTSGGYPIVNESYGGFSVQNSDHWVFEGTGLIDYAMLGLTASTDTNVLDHEVDGAPFNCAVDGRTILGPVLQRGTPENFTILGVAPAYLQRFGMGVMGIWTTPAGGALFATNTTGWSNALSVDPDVAQVTRNVLTRFLDRAEPLPQELPVPSETSALFLDRFNCSRLRDNWVQDNAYWDELVEYNYSQSINAGATRFSDACGVEGSGLALPLTVDGDIRLTTQVLPNWQGVDSLYTRLYLDLAKANVGNGDEFDVLQFYHDTRTGSPQSLGAVRISNDEGVLSIQYVFSTGEHVDFPHVPSLRPFLLETYWEPSVGKVMLWIDNMMVDGAVSRDISSSINRVDLGIMGRDADTSGELCADEFVLRTRRVSNDPTPSYSAQIDVKGGGEIMRTPDQERYDAGQTLVLTAVPDDGWLFNQWRGDVMGDRNPIALTMTTDISATAEFMAAYFLTVDVIGPGAVSREPNDTQYKAGTEVHLVAEPAANATFRGWEGAVVSDQSAIDVQMDGDTHLIARFDPLVSLSVISIGTEDGGIVAVNPSNQLFQIGTVVHLLAVPQPGYLFRGWFGDVENSESAIDIVMTENMHVEALFLREVTVETSVFGMGLLEFVPSGPYAQGDSVTITALPTANWLFSEWLGDVASEENPLVIELSEDMFLGARFEEMAAHLSGDAGSIYIPLLRLER